MIKLTLNGFEVDLAACVRFARKEHGKGPLSLLVDILRLRLGRNRLGVKEYFVFGLYDDRRFDFRAKSEFLGWRRRRHLYKNHIPPEWLAIAHDKLITYAVLTSHGLRQPELRGVYHAHRSFASIPAPHNPDQLKRFLREEIDYPFFMKPVWGEESQGAASVESVDRTNDLLIMPDGARVSIDDFVARIDSERRSYCAGITADFGYMFQERLKPHPKLEEICGACLSSARIIVLVGQDGPEIIQAAWKIPTGQHIADNFWRQGNMMASIDATTGRVGSGYHGAGPSRQFFERHPDSGLPLTNLVLPDWDLAREVTLAAAACLPGMPFQGWDIAFSSQGPIALEVQPIGGVRGTQRSNNAGIGNDHLYQFVDGLSGQ